MDDLARLREFRRAVPPPNAAARNAVRAAMFQSRDRTRRRFHWPSVHLSAARATVLVAAVAVAFSALALNPLRGSRQSPLSPAVVLANAVQAMNRPVPSAGTARVSYMNSDAVAITLPQQKIHHLTVTSWTLRDWRHWRIHIAILAPDPVPRSQTVVANGRRAVYTDTVDGRLATYPINSPLAGAGLFGMFLGAETPEQIGTLKHMLRTLMTEHGSSHVRLVGQAQILGRRTAVVEISPFVCSPTRTAGALGTSGCTHGGIGYGRKRLWIDERTGMTLRVQGFDVPYTQPLAQHNFLYRVTKISFGSH
jgi:hypothetical protein